MVTNRSKSQNLESGNAHIWLVIALIVIILGLLGFVLWQQLTRPSGDNGSNINTNARSNNDGSGTIETKTYNSVDVGYIKSFDYPAEWSVVDEADTICKDFDYCASPPTILVVDNDNSVRVTFSAPQSDSDTLIDDQASSIAEEYEGKIASGFTSLDGVQARKIEYPDGKLDVVVLLNKGYGFISFTQPTNDNDASTVLSNWKWQ